MTPATGWLGTALGALLAMTLYFVLPLAAGIIILVLLFE